MASCELSSSMAATADDEIVEHTLTQIQECYLFELPPRVRAQGWLAADMTKQMWTGRMRVVQRGMEAAIMLVDRRDGKLFAMCKVSDGAVERVPDSSRYFVIKIQNAQGRHAFVGLAFDDRNQAFDFNVALQEFKKDVERTAKLSKEGDSSGDGEQNGQGAPSTMSNLSLKDGEKIKISIGGGSKRSSRPKRSGGAGGGLTLAPPPGDTARKPGGIGLLAPPPGDTRRARGIAKNLLPQEPTPAPAPATNNHLLNATCSPPAPGGNVGGVYGGGNSSLSFQGAGGGGGLLAMLPAGRSAAASMPANPPPSTQEDDDPLGLGLGSLSAPQQQSAGGSSLFSSPPPPPGSGAAWGLSDMSGLGVGLPPGRSGSLQPSAARPGAQSQQQNDVFSQDPFSQPPMFSQTNAGQQGFPVSAASSSVGLASGTGGGVGGNKTTVSDDPFSLF